MYENILLAIFLYYPEPIFLSQFLCGVTGLEDGQSIIVTKLTQSDLTATYSSDASTNFVPYIQDPTTSMDMVQRLLYKRQVLIVYVLLTDQINLYKLKKIYLYTCVPYVNSCYFCFAGSMAMASLSPWYHWVMLKCQALFLYPTQTL